MYWPGSHRDLTLGIWYIPIATFIIVAMSNAVNLTDGLDGLAGLISATAFAAYGGHRPDGRAISSWVVFVSRWLEHLFGFPLVQRTSCHALHGRYWFPFTGCIAGCRISDDRPVAAAAFDRHHPDQQHRQRRTAGRLISRLHTANVSLEWLHCTIILNCSAGVKPRWFNVFG